MPVSAIAETDFKPRLPGSAASLFAKRAGLTGRGLKGIIAESKARARIVSASVRAGLVDRAMAIIRRGIANGDSFATVQRRLLAAFSDAGDFQLPLHRLRLIIRQSTLTTFNVAKQRVSLSEPVRAAFPFWQYLTVRDRNVRPEHAALHGRIFDKDDPIKDRIWPPWGYNCRCTTRDVSAAEAARAGVTTGADALTKIRIPGTDQRGIVVPPEFDHPRDQFRGGADVARKLVEPSIRALLEESIGAKAA